MWTPHHTRRRSPRTRSSEWHRAPGHRTRSRRSSPTAPVGGLSPQCRPRRPNCACIWRWTRSRWQQNTSPRPSLTRANKQHTRPRLPPFFPPSLHPLLPLSVRPLLPLSVRPYPRPRPRPRIGSWGFGGSGDDLSPLTPPRALDSFPSTIARSRMRKAPISDLRVTLRL